MSTLRYVKTFFIVLSSNLWRLYENGSRSTVSRWLRHGSFPEQRSPQHKTRFDPHLKAIAERWEAGCHNIAQLHRELVAAGHTLTYRNVYRQLVRYRAIGQEEGCLRQPASTRSCARTRSGVSVSSSPRRPCGPGPRNVGAIAISAHGSGSGICAGPAVHPDAA